MKTVPALLAALVLSSLPLSASHAQSMPAALLLDMLDGDGDGTVSKQEVEAARDRLFGRLDFDGDGMIDEGEIETLRDAIMDHAVAAQTRIKTAWRRMDADGDASVSPDEFRSRTVLFDLADRDADGKLSPVEFAFIRTLVLGAGG
jgi:hypothetical protein